MKIKERIGYFLRIMDRKNVIIPAYYKKLEAALKGKDNIDYHLSTHFLKNKISKKKYCVFRMPFPEYSLFAVANTYIFIYEWAIKNGFIPLIDLEFNYSYMQGRLGEDNKWEYCFEQPITMQEIGKQDYVIVKNVGAATSWLEKTCMDINGVADDRILHVTEKNWKNYYANIHKYVKRSWWFKQEIVDEFEEKYGNWMSKGKCILGVFLREGFSEEYHNSLNEEEKKIYQNHPKVPNVDVIIKIVKEYMMKNECDYIFLSTLNLDSVDKFKAEFGDIVITVDRCRGTLETGIKKGAKLDISPKEMYVRGKNVDYKRQLITYTQEIIGLSRCDYLIACKGSGAAAALSLNGGLYKDIYILPDLNKSSFY